MHLDVHFHWPCGLHAAAKSDRLLQHETQDSADAAKQRNLMQCAALRLSTTYDGPNQTTEPPPLIGPITVAYHVAFNWPVRILISMFIVSRGTANSM